MSLSLSPSQSTDSTASTKSSASSSKSMKKRSQLRKTSTNNKKKAKCPVKVVAVLRVVVLAFFLVFLFVGVLQSQHVVLQENGMTASLSMGLHPASHKSEWKVKPASNNLNGNPIQDTGGMFNVEWFRYKLTQWRQQTHRQVQHQSLQNLRRQQEEEQKIHVKSSLTSRLLQSNNNNNNNNMPSASNTTTSPFDRNQLYVPFWDQQALYRRRNSWHLMVFILADDCLPHYYKGEQYQPHIHKNPTLRTLRDVIQTNYADIIVYFPQPPKSVLFANDTEKIRPAQQSCQAQLQAQIQTLYSTQLQTGQLQWIQGIVNPLPPRIKYEYNHRLHMGMKQLEEAENIPLEQHGTVLARMKLRMKAQQLKAELDYSLGLEFAYISELVYEHGDLLLFLRAGTTLIESSSSSSSASSKEAATDYAKQIVDFYENHQQRSDKDLLVHRFCYMSFLQQDEVFRFPGVNETVRDMPPRYQAKLGIPSGIVMERHGLYRWSMVLRSLLPYRKSTTTELLMQYCDELLWESQVMAPISQKLLLNDTSLDESVFPSKLFVVEDANTTTTTTTTELVVPAVPDVKVSNEAVAKELELIQRQQQESSQLTIPPWVTVDNSQLGPQRTTNPADIIQLPHNKPPPEEKKMVTFVVPTATRPNGIKNQYVTYSLNQLFPLIRRDFHANGKFQATVLVVICGNTQEELDDHQKGLWEYYAPELKEGILEVVATNLDTYPSLHNIPNNYNDPENRLRWRSKQNLDISSSFFAAKGKSEYIMLLEDDTGYRDPFTSTLKEMIEIDQREEAKWIPNDTGLGPFPDDYRQHVWSQVHFGFGYSGVLIHDEDALVYATLHYVLMDEKPCDLLYLANYLQGQVMDQKWRWQLKKVLLTHLGSVSSLKGKIQPVWGLRG